MVTPLTPYHPTTPAGRRGVEEEGGAAGPGPGGAPPGGGGPRPAQLPARGQEGGRSAPPRAGAGAQEVGLFRVLAGLPVACPVPPCCPPHAPLPSPCCPAGRGRCLWRPTRRWSRRRRPSMPWGPAAGRPPPRRAAWPAPPLWWAASACATARWSQTLRAPGSRRTAQAVRTAPLALRRPTPRGGVGAPPICPPWASCCVQRR